MKKLILIVFVLFSVNCFGQNSTKESNINEYDPTLLNSEAIKKDTTYYIRGDKISMTIKYGQFVPKGSQLYNKIMSERLRKKKRRFLGIF